MRPNMARSLIARRRYPPERVRIALIANGASGGGFDPEPLAATMRRHGADVSLYAPDDLDAVPSSEPERIAVAGGDGTIGACAELAGRLGVPLAVIPMGTANDFARVAELPLDAERRVRAGRHRRAAAGARARAPRRAGTRSSTSRAPGSPPRRRTAPSR